MIKKAISGVKSNIPIVGTIRRRGTRMGSVTWRTSCTIGLLADVKEFPGANVEIQDRTTRASSAHHKIVNKVLKKNCRAFIMNQDSVIFHKRL